MIFAPRLFAAALVVALLPLSGCLSTQLWNSRLCEAGEHPEGWQRFEGSLNDAWYSPDSTRLYIGGTMEIREDQGRRTRKEYGYLTRSNAARLARRHWLNLDTMESKFDLATAPWRWDCTNRRVEYRLPDWLTRNGVAFVPPTEFAPEKEGFRKFNFAVDAAGNSKKYPVVAWFDQHGYSTGAEVADKSGKVLLTPVTLVVDGAATVIGASTGCVFVVGCCFLPGDGRYEELRQAAVRRASETAPHDVRELLKAGSYEKDFD